MPKYYSKARGKSKAFFAVLGKIILSKPGALLRPGRGVGTFGASRAPPPTRGMPFHVVGAAIGRPVCEANNRPQGDPAACVVRTRSRHWGVRGVEGAAPYTGNAVPCRRGGGNGPANSRRYRWVRPFSYCLLPIACSLFPITYSLFPSCSPTATPS